MRIRIGLVLMTSITACLVTAPPRAQAARQVRFDEAWPRAQLVVRGTLEASRWHGPRPQGEQPGRIVYHVKVNEVWKGRAETWIQITEAVNPGVDGCVAGRPRKVGTPKQYYFFLRYRPDGRWESAAWSSCGLLRLATPALRKQLLAKQPKGPSKPRPGGQPPPQGSRAADGAGGRAGSGCAKGGCGCATSPGAPSGLPLWPFGLLWVASWRRRTAGRHRCI
jgi:MYXO-CTERM domain-containing protein